MSDVNGIIGALARFRDAKIAQIKQEAERDFGLTRRVVAGMYADWSPDEMYFDYNRLNKDIDIEKALTVDRAVDDVKDVFSTVEYVLRMVAERHPEYLEGPPVDADDDEEDAVEDGEEDAVEQESEPESVGTETVGPQEPVSLDVEPQEVQPDEPEIQLTAHPAQTIIPQAEPTDTKPPISGSSAVNKAIEKFGIDRSKIALGMLAQASEKPGGWISFASIAHRAIGLDASQKDKALLRAVIKSLKEEGYVQDNGASTRGVKYVGDVNLMMLLG